MKHLFSLCLCASVFNLFATPFAPDPSTEVVVYSPASTSPLHVSTVSTNPMDSVVSRAFPPSYTGHRAVCPIPRTTTNDAFCAWIGGEEYASGDLFGVSSGRGAKQIDLSLTSSISPRVKIWGSSIATMSDRAMTYGEEASKDIYVSTNRFVETYVPDHQDSVHVRVVRYKVDRFPVYKVGVDAGVVLEKDFEQTSRDFLHEGDFLADGDLDIDWKNLYSDVVDWWGAQAAACEVTNVTYLVVYGNGPVKYETDDDTNTVITASPTLVNRRFEKTRSVPTAISAYHTPTNAAFSFRIYGEDPWASQFGTTYTAFKVKVLSGSTDVWSSGIRRLPARDKNGVYTFTTSDSSLFTLNSSLTWRVAVYNAKFKTDTLMAMDTEGDPFSPARPIATP